VPKKKLKRFRENLTFDNLFQLSYTDIIEGFHLKGNWRKEYFGNDGPIVLELGCGKGEYTTYLATKHPEKNFIGLDIKGARLWRGCKTAIEENLRNVAFIRARIELIDRLFAADEIDEIWLTFPDPQLRQSRSKKRLSSPFFLEKYSQVMKDNGLIHLKTDNEELYNYTLDLVKSMDYQMIIAEDDIYGKGLEGDMTAIRTFYEKMFLENNIKIKYLEFKLPHER
jgi:tRNA (guanine-N7-)-methyltransferase